MTIQFRLGSNDHKPLEDFLSRDHAGTGAIVLDTKAVQPTQLAAPESRSTGSQRPRD